MRVDPLTEFNLIKPEVFLLFGRAWSIYLDKQM